ncbi:MAG: hypothetical protein AAF488_16480 [Planctomycetota bacterium]
MGPLRCTPLLVLLVTLGCSATAARSTQDSSSQKPTPPENRDPVSVYAKLDGRWVGTFIGYDTEGREQYRIAVEQIYRTIDANTQIVKIRDTMPDGQVITGEGENTARRRADGSLELRCVVRKSNGDRVAHEGRCVKGPDGDDQLIWFTNDADRTETFRETVRTEGSRTVYSIDGLGRYGKNLYLMHGRYTAQPAAAESSPRSGQ